MLERTWTIVVFVGGAILCWLSWFAIQLAYNMRPRRKREPGFEYVYVLDSGEARELDDGERKYLQTEFHGGDGARPYIKDRYESLTPDGKIKGYLRRRQLPRRIEIHPADFRELTQKY